MLKVSARHFFCIFCTWRFLKNISKITKKIRELPVEELYDILSQIRDHGFQADDSPERIRIIEKRIIELTGDKNAILPIKQYNAKIEEKYLNKTTPGSFVIKLIGIILIIVGFNYTDNPSNQYTSFNFITSGLGFLTFVIGCTIDDQLRLDIILVINSNFCAFLSHFIEKKSQCLQQ